MRKRGNYRDIKIKCNIFLEFTSKIVIKITVLPRKNFEYIKFPTKAVKIVHDGFSLYFDINAATCFCTFNTTSAIR